MRVVTRTRIAAAAVCAAVVAGVIGAAGSAETLVERGAYLVTTVAACGNCHTPRDAAGKPGAGALGLATFRRKNSRSNTLIKKGTRGHGAARTDNFVG